MYDVPPLPDVNDAIVRAGLLIGINTVWAQADMDTENSGIVIVITLFASITVLLVKFLDCHWLY